MLSKIPGFIFIPINFLSNKEEKICSLKAFLLKKNLVERPIRKVVGGGCGAGMLSFKINQSASWLLSILNSIHLSPPLALFPHLQVKIQLRLYSKGFYCSKGP